jgi:hypothetical protein
MITLNKDWLKIISTFLVVSILVSTGLALDVKPVQAASITLVTDFLGDDPTKSACTNAIDDCSLRGAIKHVNTDTTMPKPDYHIQLGEFTYTLTNHGANENGNVTGDLDIVYPGGNLSIEGASGFTTIIDGDLADRVIDLFSGSLTLSNLSVRHGNTSALMQLGAGIYAHPGASLSLLGVDVSDNISGSDGGGIDAYQATLFMYLCSIRNNQANSGGGIITFQSTSTIIGVSFSGNTAGPGTTGGGLSTSGSGTTNVFNSVFLTNTAEFGGGVFNGTGHTMNIIDSAFMDNTAYAGAGIYTTGIFSLERAYISGNIAESAGGGLEAAGTFSLIDVTIANNTSDGFSGVFVYNPVVGVTSGTMDHVTITGNISAGGRAPLYIQSGTVSLMNSIVHATDGNAACEYPNANSFLISSDYNIASDGSCNLTQAHDHPNTDPQINTPGYYGGLSLIAPPLAGSIAIDNANPVFLPTDIDQRGALRVDGDFNGLVLPDIGAAEFLPTHFYLPLLIRP